MGLLNRLFGQSAKGAPPPPEQAVIVHFTYGSTDLSRLFALEGKLEEAIAAAGVGEFDGNEMASDGADGFLYMYGPSADALFGAVRASLEATDFMRGARVTLRYGPPAADTKEIVRDLGA